MEAETKVPSQEAVPPVVVKKRHWFKRTLEAIGILLLSVVILALLVGVLAQVPLVRTYIVNKLILTAEKSLNATITIGSLEGNLISGAVLTDVALRPATGTKYDTTDLLHADHVILRYSLFKLVQQLLDGGDIKVKSIALDHPTILFAKNVGDSLWNYERLIKPSAPSAPSKPSTQSIILDDIRILNGAFRVHDYHSEIIIYPLIQKVDTSHAINWSNLDLRNLNLDASLLLKGSSSQEARIKHLSVNDSISGFALRHFGAVVKMDDKRMALDSAQITTDRSDLGLTFSMSAPTFLSMDSMAQLQHSKVKLKLVGRAVNSYELTQFVPAMDFMSNTPTLELAASGEFGKLHVDKLVIGLGRTSSIAINGALNNLHNPDKLLMDLHLALTNVTDSTLREFVPGLEISDIKRFGTVNIPSLHYVGEPLNFHTEFQAASSTVGGLNGDMQLDFRPKEMTYRGTLKTMKLNLAAAMQNPDLQSNLTTETFVDGHGTDYKTMSLNARIKLSEPGTIAGYDLTHFGIRAKLEHGIASSDSLMAGLRDGATLAFQHLRVDLVRKGMPFEADGGVKSLPMSKYLPALDTSHALADLTVHVHGDKLVPDAIIGNIDAYVSNIGIRKRTYPDIDAHILIGTDSVKHDRLVELTSNVADMTLSGTFDWEDLATRLPERLGVLTEAISNRYFPNAPGFDSIKRVIDTNRDFSMKYSGKLKDLRSLALVLPKTLALAEGTFNGELIGNDNGEMNLSLNVDTMAVLVRTRFWRQSDTVGTAQHPEDSIRGAKLAVEKLPTDTTHGLQPLSNDSSKHEPVIALNSASHDSTVKIARVMKDSVLRSPSILSDSGSAHAKMLVDSLNKFIKQLAATTKTADSARRNAPPPSTRIHLMPTTMHLSLQHLTANPHSVMQHLVAHLDVGSDSLARIGGLLLYEPRAVLDYKDQAMTFGVDAVANQRIGIGTSGRAAFPGGNLDLLLDTTSLAFRNPQTRENIVWRTLDKSHITLERATNALTVDSIIFYSETRGRNRSNATLAQIGLGGKLTGDSIQHAWLRVPNFDLRDLPRYFPFAPNSKTLNFTQFGGRVHKLDVTLDGTLQEPQISAGIQIDHLKYGDLLFDTTLANFRLAQGSLRGSIRLHGADELEAGVKTPHTLRAEIDSMPMLFSFAKGPAYSKDSIAALTKPLSMRLIANDFPIDLAEPFIPVMSQLHGNADMQFSVNGTQEKISYAGAAAIRDGSFTFSGNNIPYNFDGHLRFIDQTLHMDSIHLFNTHDVDPDGKALLNGEFEFDGFSIKHFDMALQSDRLTALNDDSRNVIKAVQGTLAISTDGGILHFRGNFDAPEVAGPLKILTSYLTIPEANPYTQAVSSEGIIYRTLPEDIVVDSTKADSTKPRSLNSSLANAVGAPSARVGTRGVGLEDSLLIHRTRDLFIADDAPMIDSAAAKMAADPANNPALQSSFMDKLQYHLRINIPGDVWVKKSLNSVLGLIGEQLQAEIKTNGTLYFDRASDREYHIIGSLDITSNSTYNLIQTFNITQGSVVFRNDPTNPDISVVAELVGPHQPETGPEEEVKIRITIAGAMSSPKMRMEIFRRQPPQDFTAYFEGNSDKEAVWFLLTNKFSAESSQPLAAGGTNLGKNVTGQLATTLFSTGLKSIGFQKYLKSANLSLTGANLTVAINDISFKVAQQYNSSALGEGFYTLDLPLRRIFNVEAFQHGLVEVQFHNAGSAPSSTTLIQQPNYLAKFLWNFPLP